MTDGNSRYRDLFNKAPLGYVIIDREGIVKDANETFRKMIGRGRDKLIGSPFENLIKGKASFRNKLPIFFSGGENSKTDVEFRKDSSVVHGTLNIVPHCAEDPGSPEFDELLISVCDMSELRQKLEHSVRAEKLDSIALMAGGLGHDFNNLLTGLYGYIELARLTNDECPHINELLDKALGTYERARGLTEQLIEFSHGSAPKIRQGRLEKTLMKCATQILTASEVTWDLKTDIKLNNCNFDRMQMTRVFLNILGNSLDAMPGGGNITMALSNATLTPDSPERKRGIRPGKYVMAEINDNGQGMDKRVMTKIYDPFFSTRRGKAGLGLTTCYSIIKSHKGFIYIESAKGKGTRTRVYIPCSPPEQTGMEKSPVIPLSNTGTILVMDDEADIRHILSDFLSQLGYSVLQADSSEETLKHFAETYGKGQIIDAAIVDLTVKGMKGGRDMARELGELYPHVPVFISSGYTDDPVMKNPDKFGFAGAITKPFRYERLLELLHEHIH